MWMEVCVEFNLIYLCLLILIESVPEINLDVLIILKILTTERHR